MKMTTWLTLILVIALGGSLCWGQAPTGSRCPQAVYPHDPAAFTQGLVFYDGVLLESTGRYGGHSSVRRVELKTGKTLLQQNLPPDYFGEGLALHDGVLYQLTWHNGIVLRYNPNTLEPLGSLKIKGEAWGLASDGRRLVMSDGSAVLRFVNPGNFAETGRILVHDDKGEVSGLNELEFAEGHLLANIYPTNRVVIIDVASGQVVGQVYLNQLVKTASSGPRECIPNGIAYRPVDQCLLVTGKNCNQLLQFALPFP